jgi:hypothetical protein
MPVPYGQTFLRRHVARELTCTEDVLALGELRRRVLDAWYNQGGGDPARRDAVLDQRLTLARYFHDDRGDYRLYISLRVLPRSEPLRRHPRLDGLKDLTDLIQRLDPGDSLAPASGGLPPGVVLTARSGGGTTVAAIKAFCDCVLGDPPPLAGLLPCRVPVNPDLPVFEWAKRQCQKPGGGLPDVLGTIGADVVETLILEAALADADADADADPDPATRADWLRFGPPLLLVVDLNLYGPIERAVLARSLSRYQRKYSTHRCLVAYRFVSGSDEALAELSAAAVGDEPAFGLYDLEPVDPDQAEECVANVWRVEQELLDQLGLAPPTETPVAPLRRLPGWHVSSAGGGGREESLHLITTPLLMHFLASLSDAEVLEVETLADLYRTVIDRHLRPERASDNLRTAGLTPETIVVALTRVALVMLARNTLRLDYAAYQRLLEQPDGNPSWWPDDPFWLEGQPPYYFQRFDSGDAQALLGFALLRREGNQVGFLHDSFVSAFAGIQALRFHEKPGVPLPDEPLAAGWYPAVLKRLLSQPTAWLLPAEFLGGVLSSAAFEELALRLVQADPTPELPRLLQRLAAGAAARLPLAEALHQATIRTGPIVFDHPDQLLAQIYADLAFGSHPASRDFAPRITRPGTPAPRPWLRLLMGGAPNPVRTIISHKGEVTALAVLPDGRVASAGWDHTVRLWDPRIRSVQTIITHQAWVTALAVLPDGRIASASHDHTVRLWDPRIRSVQTIITHENGVTALAVLPDGRIASASWDHTVRLWDPRDGSVQTIITHELAVSALAALPDGRIASASHDHTVRLWDPRIRSVQTIITHEDGVSALAVLPDGRIASASWDQAVRLWDPRDGSVRKGDREDLHTVLEPPGNASGTARGWCLTRSQRTIEVRGTTGRAWSIEFDTRREVHCVTADFDRGRVAAGLDDGRVLIFAVEPWASQVTES